MILVKLDDGYWREAKLVEDKDEILLVAGTEEDKWGPIWVYRSQVRFGYVTEKNNGWAVIWYDRTTVPRYNTKIDAYKYMIGLCNGTVILEWE